MQVILNQLQQKQKMKAKKDKKKQGSDQSQKEEDNKSDKSDNSNDEQVDTDNSPKVIPVAKLPQKLKTKKIVINISDTQYPIIEEISEQLGWSIQRVQGAGDWDIWWTDRQITPDTLFKMNLHQKINHFPGIYVLARKNLLGLNLMAMRDRFQSQYSFFPQTWVIPLQFAKFRAFFQSTQKGKARTYIVKPEALSQGRGIFLTRSIEDIMTGHKYVVQRYLKNPLLIDDLKFDLRIYVLLAGTNPLRLYIYEQGLTRFATRKYQQPSDENLNMAFIHLTNYSLNKKNPQYVYNTSEHDMNTGHKRSLSSTYQYLAKKGHDIKKLKQQINDVIIKTIIAGLPAISHQYQYCQPEEYQNNMCFHILGVDIMITSDLKPYLIQINHTPSFQTGTPLDYKVKKNLIIDTLKIMRINSKNKKYLFQKAKLLVKKRIQTGKRQILRGDKRQQLLLDAQQKRDNQQANLLGGFKKIFPIDNSEKMQQYVKMIDHSEQVHKDTQETRRKIIRDEQQKMKKKKKCQSEVDHKQQKLVSKNQVEYHTKIKQNEQKDTKQFSSAHKGGQIKDVFHDQLIQVPQTQKNILNEKNQEQNQIIEQKQVIINTSSNIVQKMTSKNCYFRTKTKKILYNPKQQFIKFSQFMLNYISNSNNNKKNTDHGVMSAESDQEAFNNAKKQADRKRKDVPSNQKEKNREGNYIIPKMYQIIDSKAAIRIQAEIVKKIIRDKQVTSPQITESQKLKPLNSYKGMYKKKRFSLC